MRLAGTSPPGPAPSTHPKLEEDRSAPVLACCKPHPGRCRSLQLPFATSPWRKFCKLSISTSCHVNNDQHFPNRVLCHFSFFLLQFCLFRSGGAHHGWGKKAPWRLWRFLELLVNTFRQFDSMRKTMGGKMDEFSKARMPHKFYNTNFPFIGEKL